MKALELQPLALHSDFFVLRTTLMFVFTTFVLKHLAMEIDEYGMGQGITFLIAINIVTGR
jgi:preprotein translocase subunit SecY